MRFVRLDDKIINKDIAPSKYPRRSAEDSKSAPQFLLGRVLSELYPSYVILEEFPIQVYSHSTLFLDFFLPQKRMAFEFNGEQHYKYNKFFHGSVWNFKQQQKKDSNKEAWCDINDIKLYVFSNEKDLNAKTIKNHLTN